MTEQNLTDTENWNIELQKRIAKQTAERQAVIDKLGLTADEAQALLG